MEVLSLKKKNALLSLINHKPDIDQIYLFAKDPYEAKYSNDMDDILKSIEEKNRNKKRKILIAFDDMIADILSNKKLNAI